MKKFLLFVCTFSFLISCRGQDNQFPKPSGTYLPGVSYLSLIDSSRKELFDNEGKKYRELTIKIWYPAGKKTEPELYLENPEMLIANFGFSEIYRALKTKSSREVAVSPAEVSFPVLMKESPAYWADDIKFFISELERINKSDTRFKGKLDLNKLGVLGMSMGGIAANEICLKDRRVKAGLNIDGALYGSAINETLKIPYMFLNSQRYLGYGNLFTSRGISDCYSVTVRNSDHYNFTDYALYPVKNLSQIGTVDPAIPIKIINSLAVLFFNKYLRNVGNIDLGKACEGYDAEYVSNVHK